MISMSKRVTFAALAACAIAALAIAAIPATASKTVELRFFSQLESAKLTDAAGNPVDRPPQPGDKLGVTDRDFLGNHKHHAKRYTATDHLSCVVVDSNTGLCDGQFAIGGSMLLVEHMTLNVAASTSSFRITGGTGRYKGAKGTAVSTNVGDDSDIVIRLR